MPSRLPQEAYYYFGCYAVVVVLGALSCLLYQIIKSVNCSNHGISTADIPPGSRGLPFIGETLKFMASINSGKGFYEFVRLRRLR